MKKRTDGLYQSKITVGKDNNGKPVIKYVYAKTQRELQIKRKEAIEYYLTGDKSSGVKLFGDYITDWYNIRKKPFVALGTQELFRGIINNHLLPEFGERNLSAITAMNIQQFFNRLGETHSMHTCNNIRNVLVSMFECALQDGYINRNPAKHMHISGAEPADKYVLTPKDRQAIERVCQTNEDGLLLALLYYTGMRCGEARALQWKHIDLKQRLISIEGSLKQETDHGTFVGKTKTRSSVRKIPIVQGLYDCLMRVPRGMPETFVLHNVENDEPVRYLNFRIRYGRLMYEAGLAEEIPIKKRNPNHLGVKYKPIVSAHGLRHNMATMLWEHNVDPFTAAKLLGHKSIQTTMDTYTHLSQQGMVEAQIKIDNVFTSKNLEGCRKGV